MKGGKRKFIRTWSSISAGEVSSLLVQNQLRDKSPVAGIYKHPQPSFDGVNQCSAGAGDGAWETDAMRCWQDSTWRNHQDAPVVFLLEFNILMSKSSNILIVKPKSKVQSSKVKTKRTWADTKNTWAIVKVKVAPNNPLDSPNPINWPGGQQDQGHGVWGSPT